MVEHDDAIMAATVRVSGKGSGFGIHTDRGILTQRHIIGTGDFSSWNYWAPGEKASFAQKDAVPCPCAPELVLVKGRILGGVTVPLQRFAPLSKFPAGSYGAVVSPIASTNGTMSYQPGDPTLVDISASTKAGMCGAPHTVSNHIVGSHAWGNNNGENNSAIAIDEGILRWLATFPKN
jgi:hypothetical protein